MSRGERVGVFGTLGKKARGGKILSYFILVLLLLLLTPPSSLLLFLVLDTVPYE